MGATPKLRKFKPINLFDMAVIEAAREGQISKIQDWKRSLDNEIKTNMPDIYAAADIIGGMAVGLEHECYNNLTILLFVEDPNLATLISLHHLSEDLSVKIASCQKKKMNLR